jgi:hypothetical protein
MTTTIVGGERQVKIKSTHILIFFKNANKYKNKRVKGRVKGINREREKE